MRADNSHHLAAAARQRRADTQRRARDGLRRLQASGQPVSFRSVAQEAGVSRSWLYADAEVRAEIERLRTSQPATGAAAIPAQDRASDASLRSRLTLAHERIHTLTAETHQLRDQLAAAHGELRAARRQGPPP